MINEKALAVELYLLPERQRERLLSSIPKEFRDKLYRYFKLFDLNGHEDEDVLSEQFASDFKRTERLVEQVPGASAEFIDRLARVVAGQEAVFPSSLARSLSEYIATGKSHE
ncbi:hypothetical protein [Microbulbifer sp. SAOS-129_SWC]|uniref:hypothetical protein n=1 Tax=Microbulbifer sp. SAOS-129_SWC TaxID=3145235 RepID=UPI0032177663